MPVLESSVEESWPPIQFVVQRWSVLEISEAVTEEGLRLYRYKKGVLDG